MKGKLLNKEVEKYNALHELERYGLQTPRTLWFTKPSNIPFIKKVFRILRESNNVLDVACGKGSFIDHFKKLENKKIDGIDLSSTAIAARPDLKITLGSADDLPYSDNSYDCVYQLDGMEHIPVEIEEKVLDEQFRVAKNYIFHSLSTNEDKGHDKHLRSIGIKTTPVHINRKSFVDWKKFFIRKAKEHNWKIIEFDTTSFHTQVCVVMKNNNKL